jgi:hypothetical protein
MSDYYQYPMAYPGAAPTASYQAADNRCSTLVRLATVGAVVGGSAAAAANLARMQHQEINVNQMLASTAKTTVSSALATAVAGAVAGAVAEQGLVRLGVMFATGAAVLYGIERSSARQETRGA